MRLRLTFEADPRHWWLSEIRFYDGRPAAAWIVADEAMFRTPRGSSYSGDIEPAGRNERGPGRLRVEGARLTAFAPGTGPRPFEDCRFVGPDEQEQDAGANDEDPFAGPLTRLSVQPGMPAREAHRQLVQPGICHDFRYSWWTEPPRQGGRRGFSQRWCIPPPGVLSADAGYGGRGEIIFFIWSDEVRGWDPFTPAEVACS